MFLSVLLPVLPRACRYAMQYSDAETFNKPYAESPAATAALSKTMDKVRRSTLCPRRGSHRCGVRKGRVTHDGLQYITGGLIGGELSASNASVCAPPGFSGAAGS